MRFNQLTLCSLMAFGSLAIFGCSEETETNAARTGAAVEDTVESAGEDIEASAQIAAREADEAAADFGRAAEGAGDEIEEETDELRDRLENDEPAGTHE